MFHKKHKVYWGNQQFKVLLGIVWILSISCLHQSAFSQSYCKVLPEEYSLADIDKVGNEYLILQSTGSIWRSLDGSNWTEDIIPEFEDTDSFGFPVAMTFFDENRGIAASISNPDSNKSSLYHTEDGGLTWTRTKLKLEDGTVRGFFPFKLFTVDEEMVLMTQVFASDMFLSSDRGATWSVLDGYSQNGGVIMDLIVIDKETWYLPSAAGLYKTSDQLESAELLIDKNFIEFFTSSESAHLYGVTYSFGGMLDLYFSDNDFATWEQRSLNDLIPGLSFVSTIAEADGIVYIIDGNRMHYSSDQGISWSESDVENANSYGLKVTQIEDAVYIHRGEILKLNCTTVNTTETEFDFQQFSVFPNPTTGILGLNGQFDELIVFDIQGRPVTAIQDSNVNQMDLTSLDSGVYFLTVVFGNKMTFHRVAKL